MRFCSPQKRGFRGLDALTAMLKMRPETICGPGHCLLACAPHRRVTLSRAYQQRRLDGSPTVP
jgi:hypothetical protein